MIYTSQNNWYSWNYDNGSMFSRRNLTKEKFKTYYSKSTEKSKTFKEELLNAAKTTLDFYPGLKPCVFFSGGLDSEIILRSYIDIGSNPEIFIIKYEKDYNAYDVN